jgi:hypothetical protein
MAFGAMNPFEVRRLQLVNEAATESSEVDRVFWWMSRSLHDRQIAAVFYEEQFVRSCKMFRSYPLSFFFNYTWPSSSSGIGRGEPNATRSCWMPNHPMSFRVSPKRWPSFTSRPNDNLCRNMIRPSQSADAPFEIEADKRSYPLSFFFNYKSQALLFSCTCNEFIANSSILI